MKKPYTTKNTKKEKFAMLTCLIDNIREQSRKSKLNQFFTFLKPTPDSTILEVGVTNEEYSPTDNFFVKHYPYGHKNITVLGIGDLSKFEIKYPDISVTSYDGKIFPFKNNQFDIAHSNAVIEHVGSFEAQELFLKEMTRVSKRGMLTTPNRHFPIEVHTKVPIFHWMGKKYFDCFLKLIGKKWATGDYMNLLTEKDLRLLVESAGINNHRIIRNRVMGFTMTLTLVWSDNIILSEDK